MDIFCEQIVKKKKSTNECLLVGLIWLAGWLIAMMLCWLGLNLQSFFPLCILGAAGVAFGAFKLASRFNLEYEYSVTNGVLDVDKIINRSDRKRMVSAEIASFDRFAVYHSGSAEFDTKRYDKVVVAIADPNGHDQVYAAVLRHPVHGRMLILFQPGEKVLTTVQKSLPRTLR